LSIFQNKKKSQAWGLRLGIILRGFCKEVEVIILYFGDDVKMQLLFQNPRVHFFFKIGIKNMLFMALNEI
jgi:hypothetical protein